MNQWAQSITINLIYTFTSTNHIYQIKNSKTSITNFELQLNDYNSELMVQRDNETSTEDAIGEEDYKEG